MTESAGWRGSDVLDEVTRRRWVEAVDAFRGASPSATRLRQVKHVRRFALWARIEPWHVTTEHVEAWRESLDEVAPSTRTSMLSSVRSFYRWGKLEGWSVTDPTSIVSHRALRLSVPTAWEDPLIGFERFLWAQGTAPTTVRSWVDQLRTIARAHNHVAPFEVTADDLFEWFAGKAWARETRRGRKVVLRAFYRWAIITGRTENDPTQSMPKVKAGDPVARPATDAEYAAAMSRAGRWELALRLAAELGMRRAEVAVVHSRDLIDGTDGTAWLTVHGKGAKVRRVPVPEPLARALRARGDGYVFPGQIVDKQSPRGAGGHVSPRYLGREVSHLLPAGVTMHALRHRFATRAYNVNRDVFTVQRLLGHASPATTQRYVQVSDATMRALVETVNA